MARQVWLDGLKVGDEVAVDFRASGAGCKVFRIDAIIVNQRYSRIFVVHGMRFSPAGNHIPIDSHSSFMNLETWPGMCCLEDPDEECLVPTPQPTRREASRLWHLRDTFGKLMSDPQRVLTFEQMEKMIRIVIPNYEPRW